MQSSVASDQQWQAPIVLNFGNDLLSTAGNGRTSYIHSSPLILKSERVVPCIPILHPLIYKFERSCFAYRDSSEGKLQEAIERC